jgi:hypothetical protein
MKKKKQKFRKNLRAKKELQQVLDNRRRATRGSPKYL